MLLEIPAEERLVGELQTVGYLLYAQLRRFQQYFYFQYDMFVDDVFCCLAGDGLHDGRQIAGGDEHLLGVERDFALAEAVFVYQLDESFEQLFLPADPFRAVLLEDATRFVVNVQKETLYVVAEDLLAETVLFVLIEVFQCDDKPVDGACTSGR